MSVRPEYISLGDLFTERLFTVPKYQRMYSWKKMQRHELFCDIEDSFNKKQIHFMSTVVILARKKRPIGINEYSEVDIVDGQQRITTLILLFKALADALSNSNSKEELGFSSHTNDDPVQDSNEEKVAGQINKTLVISDNATILLTNHDEKNYFKNYIRYGDVKEDKNVGTRANRELLDAISECKGTVAAWRQKGYKLIDLVAHIRNQLKFVLHTVEDEKLVYSVFEVLNSRGLSVSWLDQLKSRLMDIVFNDEKSPSRDKAVDELHMSWSRIYEIIGLRRSVDVDLLSFVATLKNRKMKKLTDKGALLSIMESNNTVDDTLKTTSFVSDVAKILASIDDNAIEKAVNKTAQARMLYVAIELSNLTDDEKKQIFDIYKKETFRIYGLARKDARTAPGKYIQLACKIMQGGMSADEIKQKISEIGEDVTFNDVDTALRNEDCYTTWGNELKYLMYCYEKHLAFEKGQEHLSEEWEDIWKTKYPTIEHITPQNSDKKFIHNLGNLVLLPPRINSKAKDKKPQDKHDAYKETGLLIINDVLDDLSNWNVNAVREREEKLLDWIRTAWF